MFTWQVKPANAQPEQYSFNNFLYKKVFISAEVVLPVTLVDFNALLQTGHVKTTWTVESQTNFDKYEVQHGTNGVSFNTIKSFTAATSNNYFFNHLNPNNGKNYYRLKIIDNDGSFQYSPVRSVNIQKAAKVILFPNPVKDVLTINLNTTDNTFFDVRLINMYGQQLWQKKVNGSVQVNMQKMGSGMYLLQIDNGKSVNSYKIQKQ